MDLIFQESPHYNNKIKRVPGVKGPRVQVNCIIVLINILGINTRTLESLNPFERKTVIQEL
jgi:hypothetical protein